MNMEKRKVPGSWMVISRDFGMSGGLFGYGVADINEFFTTEKKAIKYAEELIQQHIKSGLYDPHVWVLRCERTYQKVKGESAYAYSKYKEK